MKYVIKEMLETHWDEVKSIYLQGIHTNKSTFQTEAPNWKLWDAGHLTICRFVVLVEGHVGGWVALSPSSARLCYKGVVEVSLYIDERFQGIGVGTALLNYLIQASEEHGIWSLYSVIIRENTSSIALHKKCGFRKVGIREKIARMESTGKWHDIVFMERRSKCIGIE